MKSTRRVLFLLEFLLINKKAPESAFFVFVQQVKQIKKYLCVSESKTSHCIH